MILIHELCVFELWIERLWIESLKYVILAGRPERDLDPDLCHADAVLYQLSYQLHPDHRGQR